MSGESAPQIVSWLMCGAPPDPAALVAGLVERLKQAGVPLARLRTSLPTLHPEVATRALRWSPQGGVQVVRVPHAAVERNSQPGVTPVGDVVSGRHPEIRRRLAVGVASGYPDLDQLSREGLTDYFIMPLRFGTVGPTFFSIATDCTDGFTEAQLALVREMVPALTLRLELAAARDATAALLEVYLGANAAKRVMSGSFKRGGGEPIRAAIFYCDLRGFTKLSDRTPAREVVPILDTYFDAVARPVFECGGEILKFIGDAVLAIFPAGEDASAACRSALKAGAAALAAVDVIGRERAARGEAPLSIGVALHLGEMVYGNIGSAERLDFTVIGAAVNEVCRVESLCKELRVPLLVTSAFAQALGGEGLTSLGRHGLRGVSEPAELLTLPAWAPAAQTVAASRD